MSTTDNVTETKSIPTSKTFFELPQIQNVLKKHMSNYDDFDESKKQIHSLYWSKKELNVKTLLELAEENKTGIEKRLEQSDKELAEILQDGTELITNIRVANDNREIIRRDTEASERAALLEELRNESIEATAKFNIITTRWQELTQLKDPMALYEGLEYQRNRITKLMKQKDDVIKQLHEDLLKADERYYLDQEKQDADIGCLIERIDAQIEVMKYAYREHLNLLQYTIDDEREQLRQTHSEKWTKLFNERGQSEQQKIVEEKEKTEFYEKEMKRIVRQHEELTRSTRIELEQSNDNLTIDLENVKAEVMLNVEKLDYNFQIFQRRADENVIIRNQQKHRLTKMNEFIAGLKLKIKETKQHGEQEIKKLTQEVMKLHTNLLKLEEKADRFTLMNDQKYHNVWKINETDVNELLQKILSIDKVLHEQQLGLAWKRPPLKPFKTKDLKSFKDYYAREEQKNLELLSKKPKRITPTRKLTPEQKVIEARVMKLIFKKIAEGSQFLFDEQIEKLLEPHLSIDQTLVKIDNVFSALNIKSMEDITMLKEYFLPYTWCPNCMTGATPEKHIHYVNVESDKNLAISPMSSVVSASSSSFSTTSSVPEIPSVSISTPPSLDVEPVDSTDYSEHIDLLSGQQHKGFCSTHYLIIQSRYVLTALREYMEDHHAKLMLNETNKIITMSERLANERITLSRSISKDDVHLYWNRYKDIFPSDRIRLWTALDKGLLHYLQVLKKREKFDTECEFLRKQNIELKHLLQRYLPPINQ